MLLGALGLFFGLALVAILLFAIVAPLASVLQASGVDGRVYVVVPRSFVRWLEVQGYSLGSLFIAVMSPLDYEGYSYWLRGVVGDRLLLDFRRVARSWEEFYKDNPDVLKSSPPLPTVSITITLSRVEGDRVLECTAHYTYSTIDYFIERGLRLEKAVESSGADPLAHLRKPLVVVLNPRMPKGEIKVSCVDLSPIVEDLRKAMGGDVRINGESSLDAIVAQDGLAQRSACPAWFTEVWWSDIYNSRNSPPGGWMSNIYYTNGSQVPDSLKLRVWSAYARNWSLAYYYKADRYSVENAKWITLWELSFRPPSNPAFILGEKVYWMDEWVNRVFKTFTDPHRAGRMFEWKDYNENNPGAVLEWTDYQPFFGIRWENPKNKAFAASGAYAVFKGGYYRHGVTVAGFIFLGKESLTIEDSITIGIVLSPGINKAYVGAKTTYRYLGDGILLRLEVQPVRVVRSGVDCGVYWRVIPVHGFIPLYSVTIDLASLWKFNNNEPPFYDEILYSASLDTVYYAPVYNPQPGTVLYEDNSSHVARIASDPNLAFIVSNLFLPAFELLIDNIGCKAAPVPAVCTFVSLIASNVVSYAYEDLYDMAIAFDFTLVVGRESAIVRIDKVTLKYADNTYVNLRWKPLMVEYRIYIDASGDPPPCGNACPYDGHR